MANTQILKEFIDKIKKLENEKEELKNYEKDLFEEYKNQLDLKSFKYALRISKIKQKLTPSEDAEVDQQLEVLLQKA
jgi:uncharacterized protein (UPF0335 family)